MDATSQRFRPYVQVLTERSRPEPIFVVAFTGVSFWTRLEVPTEILILSRSQRQREIGRIIREHYAERKGSAVPFGKITGYVFHSLPDKAARYSIDGKLMGAATELPRHGRVSFGLR